MEIQAAPRPPLACARRYDWLCCFSNFHVEHHDFPDVPAFRLRALRDAAYGARCDPNRPASPRLAWA